MQPRIISEKHLPSLGSSLDQASSPDRLLTVAAPPPLGVSSTQFRGEMEPLNDVSPNVPLLSLNLPSPEIKLAGYPGVGVARRLSFSNVPAEVPFARGHSPHPKLVPALLVGSPAAWHTEFPELADLSKIGILPSDEDLKLKLYDDEAGVLAAAAAAAASATAPPQGAYHYLLQSDQQQQQQQQQQQHLVWVPHQTYADTGFNTGLPAPLPQSSTSQHHHPRNQAIPLPHGHPSRQHSLSYPPAYSLARASSSPTPPPESAAKRRAEEAAADASPPPRRKHRQMGMYSSASTSAPPRQQKRSINDFDDPGANTGKTYRGVSRHRLTQRWEASLWLNGRQLYLGGFDAQVDAAKAYDLAALACKGKDAIINFSPVEYDAQLKEIAGFSREEVVAYVRRRSAAFSRGKSKYRGVSGHNGRWEARIGSFGGRKNVSFGVFDSEEGAARQYDRALILEKGRAAKTNFPLRDYEAEVQDYNSYMTRSFGHLPRGSAALLREVQAYTLPIDRIATADEKKRSAIIYGESLKQALEEH